MKKITIGSLTVGALLLAAAPAAMATPFNGECPQGFLTWPTSTGPYGVDDDVDLAGNGDGTVCARKLGQGINRQHQLPLDFAVYMFVDN